MTTRRCTQNKSENEKRYAIVKRKINVNCNEGARETSNVCLISVESSQHNTTQHWQQHTSNKYISTTINRARSHTHSQRQFAEPNEYIVLCQSMAGWPSHSLYPTHSQSALARTSIQTDNIVYAFNANVSVHLVAHIFECCVSVGRVGWGSVCIVLVYNFM